MKLEEFFFNCSQEDWGQSWNRHKDNILDCSVVTQGCPYQAAKGSNGFSTSKPVQFQAPGDCFCAPFPQAQWGFVCAMLKVGNSPLRICSASCFRLPNIISIENSCLCCYELVAILCASALQQLISVLPSCSGTHACWFWAVLKACYLIALA